MGFAIQQDEANLQASRAFQVNAELAELRLLECSATTSPPETEKEGRIRLGLELDTAVIGHAPGRARFGVKITVHGDTEKDPAEGAHRLFEVSCRYCAEYSLKEGYEPSQAELEAFKQANAVFQCWPYARELVHSLTQRMGLQLPPLPLLRIAPKPVPKVAPATRGDTGKQTRARAGAKRKPLQD